MITSHQNSHLKDIRRLRRSKGDVAIVEGPHLIHEALQAGLALRSVLVTPDFLASAPGHELERRLPYPALEVEPRLLDEVADSDSPRGIVALAELPRHGVEALPLRNGGHYIYVDGLQDPGNLGALARVAEAAGSAGMALSPTCVHPNHPRALRASAGSLLRFPTAVKTPPEELSRHLGKLAPQWVALVPRGGRDLYGEDLEGTLIVAIGAEGPGLSKTLAESSSVRLTIPLEEGVESLNTTVAAAVVLFEIRRRRDPKPPSPG